MEISKLNTNDVDGFIKLVEIFNEVFENSTPIPNKQYLKNLLSKPDFMVFTVKVNNQVVGGLTIYILHQYYIEKPQAYIYDVGVTEEFQRKGFGKALIKFVCNFCNDHGFENAYVEAENDDQDAINFYRKTQSANELQATHFTYTFPIE